MRMPFPSICPEDKYKNNFFLTKSRKSVLGIAFYNKVEYLIKNEAKVKRGCRFFTLVTENEEVP